MAISETVIRTREGDRRRSYFSCSARRAAEEDRSPAAEEKCGEGERGADGDGEKAMYLPAEEDDIMVDQSVGLVRSNRNPKEEV